MDHICLTKKNSKNLSKILVDSMLVTFFVFFMFKLDKLSSGMRSRTRGGRKTENYFLFCLFRFRYWIIYREWILKNQINWFSMYSNAKLIGKQIFSINLLWAIVEKLSWTLINYLLFGRIIGRVHWTSEIFLLVPLRIFFIHLY